MSKRDQGIDYLKDFPIPYTKKQKIVRLLWMVVWNLLIRTNPRGSLFNGWRRFWYRAFGAKIAETANVHSSAWVFMPCNLEMEPYSVIGDNARIYNTAKVKMGRNSIISQHSYLCTTSHNISSPKHEQIDSPIVLGDRSWIATDAFVGMGVTIGEGAVVGARACVFKDVEPWTVVGGNPAKYIKKRIINTQGEQK